MVFRIAILLVLIHIGLCGFSAEARALKCDSIFLPDSHDVLEGLNRPKTRLLFQEHTFREYSQTLSWNRKRKIRRLLQNTDYRKLVSTQAVERYSIELTTALFGSRTTLNQWLKSPEQRLSDSALLQIKEQILREGFLNAWAENHNPAKVRLLAVVADRWQRFQGSIFGQLTGLPFVLPKIKNNQLSSELLAKVIRDGFDVHAEEVRIALKKQTAIDAYNTFRRVYTPLVFGVILAFNGQQAYSQVEAAIAEQVAETVRQLQEQRRLMEENIPLLKQEQFQQAYEAAIDEFKQKWGEPPTQAEEILLKAKIEKALNIP